MEQQATAEQYQAISRQLTQIETVLRGFQQWQIIAPAANLLASHQPFCVDTLQPVEWLQWVLIPRMRALLAGRLSLPESCAITPYYELALAADFPGRLSLLSALRAFDALFCHTSTAVR